ncbi:MAG: peptidylprolyl isomerase [Erysipelotrichaceae bacterium]|nr:peptidylprolyl isomerase [Erysipelotrichaceae bacterium]
MEIKDLLKKYWFLATVALLSIVFIVVYCVSAIKNRPTYVDSKTVNGQSVVMSIGDKDFMADDLYADLYGNYGEYMLYQKWMNAVCDEAVELTDDLKTLANNYYSYISMYNEEKTIDTTLRQAGYANGKEDLMLYCYNLVKSNKLFSDYFLANYDVYGTKYAEEASPKHISHILIKVADVTSSKDDDGNDVYTANMSEEESAKLDAVLEALKTQSFEEVAKQYSEDSSKDNGGYLGLLSMPTASSTYVKPFANQVAEQECGTVSEPVLSEFGYHIIYVTEPTVEELKADAQFMSELTGAYNYVNIFALKEKADALGFEIKDENLNSYINEIVELANEELASLTSEVNE